MSICSNHHEIEEILKKKRLFIFDFDGVIVDSNSIKGHMFAKLYEPYGERIKNEVHKHHLSNGGISRFEKIAYYHKFFLNKDLTVKEFDLVCEQFSSLVINKVVASNEIPGANKFIQNYFNKGKLFFINSAPPTEELKKIIVKRGINSFFSGIYGSPMSKVDNLTLILKQASIDVKHCIFFGDAPTDFNAAQILPMDFIGIGKNMISFLEKKEGDWLAVENFQELNNGA